MNIQEAKSDKGHMVRRGFQQEAMPDAGMNKLEALTGNANFGRSNLACSVLGNVNILIGINGSGKTTLLNRVCEQIFDIDNDAVLWTVGLEYDAAMDGIVSNAWDTIIKNDPEYLARASALVKHAYPMVESLSVSEDGDMLFAKVNGVDVKATKMGSGFMALAAIIATLFLAAGGFVVIDDLGRGLHLATTRKIGRFISEVCIKENIQVFAATHCPSILSSFQSSAVEIDMNLTLINVDSVYKLEDDIIDARVIKF